VTIEKSQRPLEIRFQFHVCAFEFFSKSDHLPWRFKDCLIPLLLPEIDVELPIRKSTADNTAHLCRRDELIKCLHGCICSLLNPTLARGWTRLITLARSSGQPLNCFSSFSNGFSIRCRFFSTPSKRSPTLANRSTAFPMWNCWGVRPGRTSLHSSGVETGAPS
jgi:hypothetical protein